MGKNIIAQKRGRGGPTYRVPNYHFQPQIIYRDVPGRVVDILNDKRRNTPLAKIMYDDRFLGYVLAPEGVRVGSPIEKYVQPLTNIAVGSQIFGIETVPNSGPKLCRTSGSAAFLVSKDRKKCIIQLPSKRTKSLDPNCRATLGVPAGGGRKEKPWVKAGKKWHAMHARGKMYPRTSAVKMNALDHPFGGPSRRPGKSKSVSRNAPPGRKVGSISSRRTGRKKR